MEKSKLKEEMDNLRQVKDVVYESQNCCPNLYQKIEEMVMSNPNDMDLGKVVRNFYWSNMEN